MSRVFLERLSVMMGKWMVVAGILVGGLVAPLAARADTTCYGDGEYRVGSTVTTHADGSTEVHSSDTMGNT